MIIRCEKYDNQGKKESPIQKTNVTCVVVVFVSCCRLSFVVLALDADDVDDVDVDVDDVDVGGKAESLNFEQSVIPSTPHSR